MSSSENFIENMINKIQDDLYTNDIDENNNLSSIEILKKYNFKHPIEYNKYSVLNDNLKEDLEINDEDKNIINKLLDKKNKKNKNLLIKKWSSYYSLDKDYIKDNQTLLLNYENKENNMNQFIDDYMDFKSEKNFLHKYQYIQFKKLNFLNTIIIFLQLLAIYNICSPLFTLLAPVLGLIIPYFVLYFKGIRLSFKNYKLLVKKIIFNQYIIKGIFNVRNNTLQNNMYLFSSIFFYSLSIYNNVCSCIQFYKNTNFIINFINNYDNFIKDGNNLIDNIYNYTEKLNTFKDFNENMLSYKKKITFIENELNVLMSNSNKYVKYGKIGYLLKHNFDMFFNKDYNDLMMYLIYLNNYNEDLLSLSKYVKEKKINKCTIVENKTPIIKKMYYLPHILDKPVKNTVSLNNNLLITGPNASGKTTLIKSVLINLFLSQSIGFGCYSKCKTKIYDYFHSYLNIPDTSNRDSLFQAEARRCKDIIEFIKENEEKNHLCIFDEIYSGTNPNDAILCAKLYLNGINKLKKNVDYVLTTHYIELCENFEKSKNVKNKKMFAEEDASGNIIYSYKITDGISKINGGYQILEKLDYPEYLLK
tara:strand:+ start:4917 stop:6683 length:1767 start_codon:yes stop_codon:yes gene_type:complete